MTRYHESGASNAERPIALYAAKDKEEIYQTYLTAESTTRDRVLYGLRKDGRLAGQKWSQSFIDNWLVKVRTY